MNDKTKKLCDDLVSYSRSLKRKMIWEPDPNSMAILSGFLCLSQGAEADVDKYVACKKLLKRKVNIFSEFRGISEAIVITKMMIAKDPEEYLDGAMAVYRKLREIHKVFTSSYMVLTALTLYEAGGIERADENIEKLESLYKKANKQHPLLVGSEDRPFFAILVTSGISEDKILEEMEECYKANKKVARLNKECVHSMAQLMCLSSKTTDVKAEVVKDYLDGLKSAKKKINKDFGLPAAGAMTLLDLPTEELVSKTIEIDDYLKMQKGFKWYSVSPSIRRMYDQMIVLISELDDHNSMRGAILTSTISTVLIQQIITYVIIMEIILISAMTRSHNSSN